MTLKRLTCLWPGLARLWFRGEWTGLLAACLFAVVVNLLIAATLVWPEVAPASMRTAGIFAAALWWLIAGCLSLRELPQVAAATDGDPQQGLFVAAQSEYLKGNWIEAEAHLRKLLRRRPRDVEALLLLATLYRRTQRFDEARRQLQQMARLDAARPWQVEVRSERELLRRQLESRRLKEIEASQPKETSQPKTESLLSTDMPEEPAAAEDPASAPDPASVAGPASVASAADRRRAA